MRICPKCSAYYADDSTAFCLVDGMPLVNVEPGSDTWSEGARVTKEKETELKKQKRKLKWRWTVMSVMTALILTMIVAKSFTLETTKPPSPLPTPEPSPSSSPSPLPSPSRSPTPAPTPTIVIKETPTPTIVIKSTPTIVIKPTPTIVIKSTPTIVIKPTPTIVITPTPTIVITSTPKILIKETATPTRSPTPQVCSDADQRRDEQIIKGYFPNLRRNIQGEQARIIAENVPAGASHVEAILGEIEFNAAVLIPCKSAAITARYAWQVSYSLDGMPPRIKTVSRKRTSGCAKVFGMWVCR